MYALGALFALSLFCTSDTPVFTGRAINAAAGANDSRHPRHTVQGVYNKMKSGRSLLIYNCADPATGEWCKDSSYAFSSVLKVAAKNLDPLEVVDTFIATGGKNGVLPDKLTTESFMQGMAKPPLAIVNRMDLAEWEPAGSVRGAWVRPELRFVYGYERNFTIIVEFVLPDSTWREFRDRARAWNALSAADSPFAPALSEVVEGSRYKESLAVRIRVNRSNISTDPCGFWLMGQWSFARAQDGGWGFQVDPLTDQIKPQPPEADYLKLWSQDEASVRTICIPKTLQANFAKYIRDQESVAMPSGVANPQLRVRNILALQQCTLCHTSETGTSFQHISNDQPAVTLSAFLTGPSRKADGLFSDLTKGDPPCAGVCVSYCTQQNLPHDQACTTGFACAKDAPAPTSTTRKFNDLARRKLFLSYLVNARRTWNKDDETNIMNNTVDFVD
jgi:hypothetical protein